jgi:hypothetical protein
MNQEPRWDFWRKKKNNGEKSCDTGPLTVELWCACADRAYPQRLYISIPPLTCQSGTWSAALAGHNSRASTSPSPPSSDPTYGIAVLGEPVYKKDLLL